jgi:hypothetical protein
MRKKIEILEEKLVKASKTELSRLSQQINKDPELYQMLVSPMEDIPQYHYLYSSGLPHLGQHSLFDVIQYMLNYEYHPNFYFSKVGYEFTGFVVYTDNGTVINDIKMASFKDDRKQTNPILAKDLIEFVLVMAPYRSVIEWLVDPKNDKATRQYNAVLDRKGLNWKSVRNGKMIKYVVQGFKTQTPTKLKPSARILLRHGTNCQR